MKIGNEIRNWRLKHKNKVEEYNRRLKLGTKNGTFKIENWRLNFKDKIKDYS